MQDTGTPEYKWRRREREKKRRRAAAFILAALFAAAAAGAWLAWKYLPTKERMDPAVYFGDAGEDRIALVLEDHMEERAALVKDGAVYLDFSMIRENITTRFYWDEENSEMLYTTDTDTWHIPEGSASYTADGEEKEFKVPIVLAEDGSIFFSEEFLARFADVECYTDEGMTHAFVRYDWSEKQMMTAKRDTVVRYQGGIKSPILTDVAKGESVRLLEQGEKWARVVSADGYIGYVRVNRFEDAAPVTEERTFEGEAPYSSLTRDDLVNLVWHQIDNADSNDYLDSAIENMTGVNVISPTWFSLSDNNGNIRSLGDKDYVRKAHRAGLDIWVLVDNFAPEVDTTVLMQSTAMRAKMIRNIVEEALELKVEGVNLDFEYIYEEDRYHYVQFVREMGVACRAAGLVFSVDVPEPYPFNTFFERDELGRVADYVILMGYDEHYSGSPAAGSVASLSFEEEGIQKTLQEVPAGKILSGVPFYTRIWYTTPNGDGTNTVTSELLGMSGAAKTVESYGLTPEWDEKTGQYYVGWDVDGTFCEIWLEDAASIAEKASLVSKYELGGIAAWVLGSQTDDIWQVISDNIAPGGEEGED